MAAEFPKGTLALAVLLPFPQTCRMGRSSMLTLAGETLGEAARNNSQMALSLLLEAGVDPDDAAQQYDPGGGHGTCSPLYLAVVFGNTRIAEQLLEAKADTEWQHPQYETTALHVACRSGHRTAAKLLLDNKADRNSIDGQGFSPLIVTALYGATECATLVLESKGDPAIRSPGLGTALKIAQREGHDAIAALLTEHFEKKAAHEAAEKQAAVEAFNAFQRRETVGLPLLATDEEVQAAEDRREAVGLPLSATEEQLVEAERYHAEMERLRKEKEKEEAELAALLSGPSRREALLAAAMGKGKKKKRKKRKKKRKRKRKEEQEEAEEGVQEAGPEPEPQSESEAEPEGADAAAEAAVDGTEPEAVACEADADSAS